MSRRDRTIIARCEADIDEYLGDYAAYNGLKGKSEAVRHIIREKMNERGGRFGEMKMVVPMDMDTFRSVNAVIDMGGHDIKSIFFHAFRLWKQDMVMDQRLDEIIARHYRESASVVYGSESEGKGGPAKKA